MLKFEVLFTVCTTSDILYKSYETLCVKLSTIFRQDYINNYFQKIHAPGYDDLLNLGYGAFWATIELRVDAGRPIGLGHKNLVACRLLAFCLPLGT